MIFSVEPGIYISEDIGVRVEDLVLVTEDGCERLNKLTKELVVIKQNLFKHKKEYLNFKYSFNLYYIENRIPAIVPVKQVASAPPNNALNPNFAIKPFFSGAKEPIPPIWIATELMLANPHKA